MNNELNERHVVILGGSSGIGKELAINFPKKDKVSVFARRGERLKSLKKNNSRINIFTCDVTIQSELKTSLEECVLNFGKINILIYCAGKQIIKPLRLMTENDIDALYKVNLKGALMSAKLFCSSKVSLKESVYCCISSIAAKNPEPGIIGYSAMKAGLEAMIFGLAKEASPRRFIGIAPGWVDTEMTRNQPIYDDKFKEVLEKDSPLGITKVENIVDAICFLVSEKASAITGKVLTVDSGISI